MSDNDKVAKFLIELRKEAGYTQQTLADELNVIRTTVSKWERGVYLPTSDCLLKLSELYNISINEILYGERITEDNKDEVNKMSAVVIKKSESILRHSKLISFILTLAIFFAIFATYFISNYNSIRVYRLYGESEKFYIRNGLMIITKYRTYIKLGNVESLDGVNDYEKYYFYYLKNDEKVILNDSNDLATLIEDLYGYDEYFSYNEINNVLNNLYIDIYYEDKVETIRFDCKQVMANDKYFYKKNDTVDNINSYSNSYLPRYIINEFEFNEDENYFFKNSKNFDEFYYLETNTYRLNNKKTNFDLLYNINDYSLKIYNNIDSYVVYNIKMDVCVMNNCDIYMDYIENFKINYLPKIS